MTASNAYTASSLDAQPTEEDGGGGEAALADRLGYEDDGITGIEYIASLKPMIASLPARERQILSLRFVSGMTQSEIGESSASPRCTSPGSWPAPSPGCARASLWRNDLPGGARPAGTTGDEGPFTVCRPWTGPLAHHHAYGRGRCRRAVRTPGPPRPAAETPWSRRGGPDTVEALRPLRKSDAMTAHRPTTTLWRPTGPVELDLVRESGWRAWPPRLPEQPIFYPVMNEDYAIRIARDWNVKHSGAGFVTRFEVDAEFLRGYPVRQAGGRTILELWVPAEELEEFNAHIVGRSRWSTSSAERRRVPSSAVECR